MRDYDNGLSAAIFERMAKLEIEREQLILAWADAEKVLLDPHVAPIHWEDPNVGTQYDAAARDPIRSTPYRVLAYVVHREEHAFRFFTHVAAGAGDTTVREYAEILAQEELGHASMARSMRRQAWRDERLDKLGLSAIKPRPDISMVDFLAMSAGLERRVHDNLLALLEHYPQLEQVLTQSRSTLSSVETLAEKQDASSAAAIDSLDDYGRDIEALTGDPKGLLRHLYTASDRCSMYYDALVTSSRDEAVMLQAQRLTTSALERLSLLREIMANTA